MAEAYPFSMDRTYRQFKGSAEYFLKDLNPADCPWQYNVEPRKVRKDMMPPIVAGGICRHWWQCRGCKRFANQTCSRWHPGFEDGNPIWQKNLCPEWPNCRFGDRCHRIHITKNEFFQRNEAWQDWLESAKTARNTPAINSAISEFPEGVVISDWRSFPRTHGAWTWQEEEEEEEEAITEPTADIPEQPHVIPARVKAPPVHVPPATAAAPAATPHKAAPPTPWRSTEHPPGLEDPVLLAAALANAQATRTRLERGMKLILSTAYYRSMQADSMASISVPVAAEMLEQLLDLDAAKRENQWLHMQHSLSSPCWNESDQTFLQCALRMCKAAIQEHPMSQWP